MRKLLLALGLLAAWSATASAQCVGVGGVNTVPIPGVTCLQQSIVGTYAATAVGLVAAATPTDIACISGSATRIVRVQLIRVSGTISTQLIVPVFITKHASANSGGTAATGTALPVPYTLDTTNGTVSATTTAWTANPTINDAAPGIIDSGLLLLSKTDGTNGADTPFTAFDYQERNYSQAPVLRGTAQQVCVNLNANAGTFTGNAINVTFVWTEQAQ